MIGISPSSSDRTARARAISRSLNRRGWLNEVISESKQVATTLRNATSVDLQRHTDRLRKHTRDPHVNHDPRILTLAVGGVMEAVRQQLGIDLFDTQLHAGILVSLGAVAEMQTGEGKTLSIALPAYFRSLAGRGVHVATPNSYLATRDHDQLSPVFASLGVTTGLLCDDAEPSQTRAAYRADITYGPGHAFGFDYLRDQLTLDRYDSTRLGHRIHSQLIGLRPEGELLQRGLYASIVDEIDHVLIDDAVSPLLLSGSQGGESADAEVHRAARSTAEQLILDHDFHCHGRNTIQLTEQGFAAVYRDQQMTVHNRVVRPWHEYVVLALRARLCFQRDLHYVVREGKILIVDLLTGRIMKDRSWSDGLHQAIEAIENLEISCESLPLARITRQRFYRYYEFLSGMTGTAVGCEKEFASIYGMPVAVVPLRVPTRRRVMPESISLNHKEKLSAIASECETMINLGRAVLVGTLSISESMEVAQNLAARGLNYQLLNGVQDADEAAVVVQAGCQGAITVATNLAGRGTDISLDPQVEQRGGLHVIVTQPHLLSRVDRQLIGRCARCGDPGSVRLFLSADDPISKTLAPWIGRAIERWDRQGRRFDFKLGSRLRRIQISQQKLASSHRWRMLKADQQQEQLLAVGNGTLEKCFQL